MMPRLSRELSRSLSRLGRWRFSLGASPRVALTYHFAGELLADRNVGVLDGDVFLLEPALGLGLGSLSGGLGFGHSVKDNGTTSLDGRAGTDAEAGLLRMDGREEEMRDFAVVSRTRSRNVSPAWCGVRRGDAVFFFFFSFTLAIATHTQTDTHSKSVRYAEEKVDRINGDTPPPPRVKKSRHVGRHDADERRTCALGATAAMADMADMFAEVVV